MNAHAHSAHMRRALELARRGSGTTRPNPMVGAVVVRDGAVVGEGYHEEYGGPHAEVNALRQAADAARGATLYVTLEPCAHQGRTPPCVDAILRAGVEEVVIAAEDPHAVAAGGAARLRDAGVIVVTGVERAEARRLNAPFFHIHERGAPWVTLKLAQSLDGAIAERVGVRTAITGPEALAETHRMRARHDAVLIGIGTAMADDPLLTVRDTPVSTQPVRVVVDTDARLDPGSRLVQSIDTAPLWVLCAPDADAGRKAALEAVGAHILHVPRGADGLDLAAALRTLYDAGLGSIFVEGGARIAASLTAQELVQRMHLFIAPLTLGRDAVRAFSDYAGLHGWQVADLERIGGDALLTLERPEAD